MARGRTVNTYQDYETMLRDETLDAVVVAVPIRLHEQVALKVIEAGKALLVEKPLAASLDEGRRIVEAASRRGVMLTSGHGTTAGGQAGRTWSRSGVVTQPTKPSSR